ncbi:hypothetical protein pb186bvf_016044 [Paramecium bursaria]
MYQNYPQGSRSTIYQRQPGYIPNPFQQQSQIYQPQQQSSVQLQEMRFAVYQDLENILVILAQTQAILDYFKNDESHPMVAVAYNRFITQLNLSNTIHLDQYHIASSDRALQKELASCKQNAKQIFGNLSQQYQGNANLQKLCRFYENKNLAGSNTSSENLPLEPTKTNYQNSINEDVIQKVVQSIGGVDQTYSKIRNGQLVQAPDQYQLAQKMKNKQMEAEYKLQQNFRSQHSYCPPKLNGYNYQYTQHAYTNNTIMDTTKRILEENGVYDKNAVRIYNKFLSGQRRQPF